MSLLVVVAVIAGIAFGAWLRSGYNLLDYSKPRYDRHFRRCRSAWEGAMAVADIARVAACGLVHHRWKVDRCDEVIECQRCGKVDWHPTRGPNAPPGSRRAAAFLNGPRVSHAPPATAERHPNLLTEFGVPDEQEKQS